jgi:L-asparaginase
LHLPELKLIEASIDFVVYDEVLDSSNVTVEEWEQWASLIEANYADYDAFLILHGTDTMAYSASALSFMLDGLSKPVIFTGAQLPLGSLRTDANRNVMTSLELALSKRENGKPMIQEVCVFFDNVLLRGNRTQKMESSDFDAFCSKKYPVLANTGVAIRFNQKFLNKSERSIFSVKTKLNPELVGSVKLYPGLSLDDLACVFDVEKKKIVILETFGSGNAPTDSAFLGAVKNFINKGGIVVNISQCVGGSVVSRKYETNLMLTEIGVLDGKDLTFEAAVTKAMFVLENCDDISGSMIKSLKGEMSD